MHKTEHHLAKAFNLKHLAFCFLLFSLSYGKFGNLTHVAVSFDFLPVRLFHLHNCIPGCEKEKITISMSQCSNLA
jgi:hypothetical protein